MSRAFTAIGSTDSDRNGEALNHAPPNLVEENEAIESPPSPQLLISESVYNAPTMSEKFSHYETLGTRKTSDTDSNT